MNVCPQELNGFEQGSRGSAGAVHREQEEERSSGELHMISMYS